MSLQIEGDDIIKQRLAGFRRAAHDAARAKLDVLKLTPEEMMDDVVDNAQCTSDSDKQQIRSKIGWWSER